MYFLQMEKIKAYPAYYRYSIPLQVERYMAQLDGEAHVCGFPSRVIADIERDAEMAKWDALSRCSIKFYADEESRQKVVNWLNGIDLYDVEPVSDEVDKAPILGVRFHRRYAKFLKLSVINNKHTLEEAHAIEDSFFDVILSEATIQRDIERLQKRLWDFQHQGKAILFSQPHRILIKHCSLQLDYLQGKFQREAID